MSHISDQIGLMGLSGHYDPMSQSERDARDAAYLEAAKWRTIRQRFEAYCEPSMRTDATRWDDPKLAANSQQIEVVRSWSPAQGRGLLITGPTGRGKTRSVCALWERLTNEGIDLRYYHAQDWFTRLQECQNYGRDDARGWIEAVASQRIVFIDDFGQEAVLRQRQDWARSWWFRFLDLRLSKALPLIVTTNLSADDMAETPGIKKSDPMIRRLLDCCAVIKFV